MMDSFDRPQDPDEGYSEDPLSQAGSGTLVRPRDISDILPWISRHLPNLPLSVKTRKCLQKISIALLRNVPVFYSDSGLYGTELKKDNSLDTSSMFPSLPPAP